MNPRNLQSVYSILKPFIFGLNLDAESMHQKAIEIIKKTEYYYQKTYSALKVNLFNHTFFSPILLAAGFDKNGLLVDNVESFAFSAEVVGSITAKPYLGNKIPRVFRLRKVKALVNRIGLNNPGALEIREKLQNKYKYVISIAKTPDPGIQGDKAIDDYVFSYRLLKNLGIYTEINISCPNTQGGKTFEDPENLRDLLDALLAERKTKPLLIKISPCTIKEKLEAIVEVSDDKVDGYVATNTMPYSDISLGEGGISGIPLQHFSLLTIMQLRTLTKKPIIGVGGIFTGWDAFNAFLCGANLLQAYTGFIYRGPTFAMEVNKELNKILKQRNIKDLSELINDPFKNYKYSSVE